jgi:superoxide dismutase, Fe-Mn family
MTGRICVNSNVARVKIRMGFVMSNHSRRGFLGTVATVPALLAAGASPAMAAEPTATKKSYEYQHVPVPLPYAAGSLKGLSEKLIQSHWDNNYGGAVRALNTLRGRLAGAAAAADTPPYVYTGLKREQLLRTGSVVLHEIYFAGLGGDGKADAALRSRIGASFGSYDGWEVEFRKIAQGLAGGSGWVMLGYNQSLKLLENYWMADHATAPANTTPLLVLDMYEHAFAMDYGAAAARYIDAFFANIHWDAVSRRLQEI